VGDFWIHKRKEEIEGEGKEGRVGSLLQLLMFVEEKGFLVNIGFWVQQHNKSLFYFIFNLNTSYGSMA
jgi:hypothetical protein